VSDAISRLNKALEGRYIIEREIGEGGMATVYLAADLRHERKVALKVLKPELAAVVGAERFLAEIKTTANLQHPHILPLFDSGEADKFLYYVMPFVEGETLQDRLDREKQLPVDEAVRIAVAVAGALDYAHKHGVVHRDIKPGNIMLQAGQPVVGDFGIALAVGAAGGARLTETGLSVGTPYYMSPEQATGDMSVGPASDIYALGAVLYELLTGDPPYMGSTAQAVLGKILQGAPVSATAVRRSIPANVDAAIRKALEKLPADRFTSAQQLADALQDPKFGHGAMSAATVRTGVWNPVSIGATAAAAVFAVLSLWALSRPQPPRPVLRFELKTSENEVPSEWIGLTPDGTAMVTSHLDAQGAWRLFVRRWADRSETPLQGINQSVNDPVVSPDGTEVAYFENSVLKVAPLAGGLIRTLAEGASCCGRWGGDGWFYYSTGEGYIERVPVDGGAVEQVTTLAPEDGGQHAYFHPLPGGKWGLFSVFTQPESIEAMDLSTGERHVVVAGMRSYYTSSGHLVFGNADGRLLAARFDAKKAEIVGQPVPVIEGVTIRNGDVAYSLADNGTLLYWQGPASSGQAEFVWVTRNGTATPVDPGWTFDPGAGGYGWRLSPDGTRLAYADLAGSNAGDIWVKDLDHGPLARLTFDPADDGSPEWSADGRTIYFDSNRGPSTADYNIWSRRADGTGEAQLVLDPARVVSQFLVTRDGQSFVFRTGDPPSRDIVMQRLGDTVATPLLDSPQFDEAGPALSPDGKWLAYGSTETGQYQVYVRPFPNVDEGRWQVSSGIGAAAPRWSRSGDELFFATADGNMVAAKIDTRSGFRVLESEVLFNMTQPQREGSQNAWYDVAPDGQRFIMVRPVAANGSDTEPELILVQNFDEELKRLLPN
jgi:serine/threonine protein kinase